MRILADIRIDGLKRQRQCICQVLTAQGESRRDHLHNKCDKQAENRHDHREGDHGIERV